tara:strand:- start:305 stop:667 length:363 start_codon:yes stop_codon:yes gene_type:complete
MEEWINQLIPIINEYKEGSTEEPLDGDDVDALCSIIKAKINLHEGNITESEYEKKVDPEFAMCDGDCECSYNVEHLHEADMGHIQYKFCRSCMFEFVANQEQEDDWLDEHDAMERHKDNL